MRDFLTSRDRENMKFIEAECPNCGAKLHLNNSSKRAFCNYCGNQIIVDTVIKLANAAFISLEKKIKSGETSLKLNEYAKARDVFDEVTEIAPERYEGWLGLFNAKSINGKIYDNDYCEDLNNALQCAKGNAEKEVVIQNLINKYVNRPKNKKKIIELELEIKKNKNTIIRLKNRLREAKKLFKKYSNSTY